MPYVVRYSLLATPLIILTALAGHYFLSAPPNGAIVTGRLLLNGVPLSHADVFLVPHDSQTSSLRCFGRSDDDGMYRIVQRVPPGTYRVIVRRTAAMATLSDYLRSDDDQFDSAQQAAMQEARTRLTPRRGAGTHLTTADSQQSADEVAGAADYESCRTTSLRMTVPAARQYATDLELAGTAGRLAGGRIEDLN